MKNVVFNGVRKILQTYIEKSYSSAYVNITKTPIVLEVLQNDVKYLYFKRNILKNLLRNTF